VKIFAHRGCSGSYPENTLLAFRAAAELPITGVEFDVQLSKDGEVVVIHDTKVNRTTDGTGYVKDKTLDELKELDCGSWFSEEWRGEKIPTLDEVLDVFEETDHILNIEVKSNVFPYDTLIDKMLGIIENRGFSRRVVISSFNHEDVLKVCRETSVKTAILTDEIMVDIYDYARVIGTQRLHVSLAGAFRKMTSEALRKGSVVYVYTVNDLQYAEELMKTGIHGVFSDYPESLIDRMSY
jgi:glycerophosphoryl diester phosphodiesterase